MAAKPVCYICEEQTVALRRCLMCRKVYCLDDGCEHWCFRCALKLKHTRYCDSIPLRLAILSQPFV